MPALFGCKGPALPGPLPRGRRSHGLSGVHPSARGLRVDDGDDPLPAAGPPEAAADVRLAGIRSGAEVSGAAQVPGLLGPRARRAAALRNGGAFTPDQAGRVPGGGRCPDAALKRAAAAARASRIGLPGLRRHGERAGLALTDDWARGAPPPSDSILICTPKPAPPRFSSRLPLMPASG